MRTSGEGAQLVYPTPSSRSCAAFRGNVAWFIGSASRATPPFCTASATRWMTSTSFGWSDVPPTPSARDMSDGPTATMSTPSVAAMASISASAGRSSTITASVISRLDCSRCSRMGITP